MRHRPKKRKIRIIRVDTLPFKTLVDIALYCSGITDLLLTCDSARFWSRPIFKKLGCIGTMHQHFPLRLSAQRRG